MAILMARTPDNPSLYGTEGYNPPLTLPGFFNKPDVDRGRPIERNFAQLTDLAAAERDVQAAYRFLFSRDAPGPLLLILREWMTDTAAMKRRYYHTFGELAWALEREHESRAALREETAVAEMVLASPTVLRHLRALAAKVARLMTANSARLRLTENAVYGPLHRRTTLNDVHLALVNESSTAGTDTLIALLHDAKDACAAAGLFDTRELAFDLTLNETPRPSARPSAPRPPRRLTIQKYGMRYNVATVDEADPWTLWMRDQNRAVWAGPSYTMIHMWSMAQTAGATNPEMEAMGFAMFAYWNLRYPHSFSPVHRFHETFAGAHKFGLGYEPVQGVLANFALFIVRNRETIVAGPRAATTTVPRSRL